MYSKCRVIGRNVCLQEHVEVVKQALFVWVGLSVCGRVWMIFGSLRVLCPSCLCCHGDSFISRPEHVFVDFVNMCVRFITV